MKIEFRNVTKSFNKGKNIALKDFNMELTLDKGIHALVGPNGAGKTTILKILCGLLYPTNGCVLIDGKSLDDKWAKDNVTMILSGDRCLYFKNTVFENMMYYSILQGNSPGESKALIYGYAEDFGILDYLNRLVEGLSSGEKKKVCILAGLCAQSKILLIDEPTWGLDIDSVLVLQELLKKLKETKDVSMIISSHDVNFLSGVADDYLFVKAGQNRGRVTEHLEVKELIENYEKICIY